MSRVSGGFRRALVGTAIAMAIHVAGGVFHPSAGPVPAQALPPIEGYGASTRGGAGHPTCVVTSLADSGSGTLRECLSAGRRTVTFAVGGTINLRSPIEVRGSFVTIDGFSAPSPGITLRGWGLRIWDQHDVIVRNIRLRDVDPLPIGSTANNSSDCISVFGPGAYNLVFDHVSVFNCGDGGLDISSGPKNITIQWSLISAGKVMLWGSTSSSSDADTDAISLHHSMLICGPEVNSWDIGCDRFPLIRASGFALAADLRRNVFEGWVRANGTKIEAAAAVNVVGNAYIPRSNSSFAQREDSIAVNSGTRVYTAGNIELGAQPRPDLNRNGNLGSPLPAPPVTETALACVVRDAGAQPRDAVDEMLVRYVSAASGTCSGDGGLPSSPPPAPSQPDLVARTLSLPGTAMAGETIELGVTVANEGSGAAAGSNARIYLSTDATLGAGDVGLGTIAVPSLAAGATVNRGATVTVPGGTASGTYRILVHLDDDKTVAESNETNNTATGVITIGSSTPSPIPALIEAESMTRAAGMAVGSDPAALGGAYISPSGSNSSTPVREASATVSVPAAGTYYLWARLYGPSKSADALYVGIDSSWARVYPQETGTWQWLRIPTASGSSSTGFSLSAGVHTIQVGRGEVGTRIDAVYLASSATDTPPTGSTPPPAPTLPALVQAESMTRTDGMTVGSDPAALGGAYISPTKGGNSARPVREASATVTVPSAGTYYLWARLYGPSKSSDALYLGIDTSWARVYPPNIKTWQWVRIPTATGATGFALSAGTHVIQVGRGEKGTRIDAVYLTDSATDVPSFSADSPTALTTR